MAPVMYVLLRVGVANPIAAVGGPASDGPSHHRVKGQWMQREDVGWKKMGWIEDGMVTVTFSFGLS
jgi:hypothetical protein